MLACPPLICYVILIGLITYLHDKITNFDYTFNKWVLSSTELSYKEALFVINELALYNNLTCYIEKNLYEKVLLDGSELLIHMMFRWAYDSSFMIT